ncbi:probable RNA polymerase II nuclear localization protein SLC7A6OS [Anthonomus grandis grandis]|uniref:probable RNA polymerase II nuclear localization protein SLC7A6OS n=1 Tax=Anthonomus grandis grandis TaxID=2921223 RepID=UPI002164F2E0|nr:probable RNA polymerase II nuclear localization protein SLC7A6OS [Anthonomus grandis grandis]
MAAVVRIKRRLDEDPQETLVLNCKKRRTNGSQSQEDLSTVLTLAGTSQKNENIETLLKKHKIPESKELRDQYKKHTVDMSTKLRLEAKEASKNNRYKVVNCFRKTLNSTEEPENASATTSTSEITVLDIETDHNCNEATMENRESSTEPQESNYVYDFYYTTSDDFGEADIDQYVSIRPLNDPLFFGSVRDNGLNGEDSEDESEDSNAENYFTNDYPDEDDLQSINEDDMIEAVNNLKIEEDLLSSDSGEEQLVYSREEEEFQDRECEVDREDELRYGKLYAKFKAKNKNVQTSSLAKDFYYGDIDEDEYYY